MSQQLTIHKFGLISDIHIDLKDLLVFIGSQASGKSTVSKAIFFFKSLRDDLTSYLYQCYSQHQFEEQITNFAKRSKQKFIKIYGSVLHFPEMELTYHYGNGMEVSIRNSSEHRFTDIIFDDQFQQKFCELVTRSRQLHDELQQKSLKFSSSREISAIKAQEATLFETITDEVNQLFNDERDLLFLPAGRSLIITLSQQRYNIDMGDDFTASELDSEAGSLIKLDYLMQNFINRIDNAKSLFNQISMDSLIKNELDQARNPDTEQIIRLAQKLVNSILKGSYRYQNGTEWIDFGNNQSTLINFASSGRSVLNYQFQ